MKPAPLTTEQTQEVYDIIDSFIDIERCVICWDHSLSEQFPDILMEQFGIRTPADVRSNVKLRRLFALIDPQNTANYDRYEIPNLLERCGVDTNRYSTQCRVEDIPQDIEKFPGFFMEAARGRDDIKSKVLELQSFLGQGLETDGGKYSSYTDGEIKDYLVAVSTVPMSPVEKRLGMYFWGLLVESWKFQDWIDPQSPTLSIGPRYLSEIRYFREIHGLENHIGLDLFSDDEGYVVAGDMHDMPFPDDHFSFIFMTIKFVGLRKVKCKE